MSIAIVGSANPGRLPAGIEEVWLSDATAAKYPHFLHMPAIKPVVFDSHATVLPEGSNPKCINIKRDTKWRTERILKFGYRFSNTLCWMLAFAIEKAGQWDYTANNAALYLTGIRMHGREEIAMELSNISYLLGYAAAQGIPVLIDKPTLLLPDHEYPISMKEDYALNETDSVESSIDQSL